MKIEIDTDLVVPTTWYSVDDHANVCNICNKLLYDNEKKHVLTECLERMMIRIRDLEKK